LNVSGGRGGGHGIAASVIGKETIGMPKDVIGSVMVVGGGIAGMQAALDLADSGYYVYLVEKSPSIGGVMAQLDKTFPTCDCAM
jgi:heterodisulfide reductase subunit A